MRHPTLLVVSAAFLFGACTDSPSPTGILRPKGRPALVITGFSSIDAGSGPGDPRPNADAAAAAFDAAASALRPLTYENLEGAPLGNFTSLTLPAMTITLTGTGEDADAGITNVPGDAILGYNTTGDGSHHLRLVPPFESGVVTAKFTPNVKLQAWGAYFTGVGTVPNTKVQVTFDDGSSQVFDVPGSANGGATFFGFTDPDRIIASVTVQETLTSSSTRDILSIDDIRFAPANGNSQFVPANEPATVTLQDDGKTVAGLDFPANTFGEAVTVTVRFVSPVTSARCHDYLLGQTGRCLEISARNAAGQKVANTKPMTAALCLPASATGPQELFKYEEPTGRPVALPQVTPPFLLDCSTFTQTSALPTRGLEGLAKGLARQVSDWLTPKSLYAAHGGFGGFIAEGDGLSFFTWASPVQIQSAGVGVNVLRSGKDVFAMAGTFDLQAKDFDPNSGEAGFDATRDAVTVGFGRSVYTIPANSFRYSTLLKRFVYASQTTTGVTAMAINPLNGTFSLAATVPTEAPLPSSRPFSLQFGHRTQGALFVCDARGICLTQETIEH